MLLIKAMILLLHVLLEPNLKLDFGMKQYSKEQKGTE